MLTGMAVPMPKIVNREATDGHRRGLVRDVGKVVWTTADACFRYRVMGLAAETAFYALLSLPPLLFALAGAIGFLAKSFSVATVATIRSQILDVAARFVTPDVVDSVLAPTLDDVLANGRVDIISIGFILALWSGSRAIAVFVDTSTIMYGMRGERGMVKSRAVSFLIYVVLLIGGTILFPLVLAGPTLINRILPTPVKFLAGFYWPIVLIGGIALLTSMFHYAMPLRRRWRGDVPGALLTVLFWIVGSWLLRIFLVETLGGASLYGPLATPIALLMWLYLVAMSILIGAAFNAAIGQVWPAFADLTEAQAEKVNTAAPSEATVKE